MAETNWSWAREITIKHIWKNNTQWIYKGLAHFTGHAEMYMDVHWSPDDKLTLSRQKVTESFLRSVFKRTDSWKWIEPPRWSRVLWELELIWIATEAKQLNTNNVKRYF